MKHYFVCSLVVLASWSTLAQNPIVQTCYTADPAPMVSGERVYLFTSHDEAGADFFWMYDWHLYSSADMVNWTDHGSPASLSTFSWADDRAWAVQCVERNGMFYLYAPVHSKLSGAMSIGVAVADTPEGPYHDALGRPLIDGDWAYIDPTVMVDNDGQSYIFWGNPEIFYAELNDDMISLKSDIKVVHQTVEGFGAPGPKERVQDAIYTDNYTEGPWIMRRADTYYLLYAAGGVPEHLAYSTSASINGPWKYEGVIMPLESTGSFTNHCGVIDFKGHSYLFYHTGKLPGGGGFDRSVAVEEFRYTADGHFPIIHHTDEGVKPIGTLNPYVCVQAETMAFSSGVATSQFKNGVYVDAIHNGDYVKLRAVDFGNGGAEKVVASMSSALSGGTAEWHIDAVDGELMATLVVGNTGGWESFVTVESDIVKDITGIHDVYISFKGYKGCRLMNFDWWQLKY